MKYIRWSWILLGGLLTELTIFGIALPLALLFGQESLLYIVPPASLFAAFTLGMWAARKVPQRRVLHGALVGTAAMLIYVGMGLGQPEPIAYIIAHALKVVGGAAGGFVALKRTRPNARPNARPV
jgi:hypothetical protein